MVIYRQIVRSARRLTKDQSWQSIWNCPAKVQAVIDKAHQARRGDDAADRPQVRPQGARLPGRARHVGQHLFRGSSEANASAFAGADAFRGSDSKDQRTATAANMAAVLQTLEACWGDAAMMLSIPYQGLGNAAISRCGHRRAARAAGQGVGRDGHHRTGLRFRLGGGVHHRQAGRRRVRHQRRKDLRHRGFACHPHRGVGDAGQVAGPRGDQIVHRAARTSRRHVERLEDKLGIKGSDTAVIRFDNARIPERQPAGQSRNRVRPRVFRRDGDLRQHPAGRRRDGRSASPAPPWKSCARS